jgi:hypothetical protein
LKYTERKFNRTKESLELETSNHGQDVAAFIELKQIEAKIKKELQLEIQLKNKEMLLLETKLSLIGEYIYLSIYVSILSNTSIVINRHMVASFRSLFSISIK